MHANISSKRKVHNYLQCKILKPMETNVELTQNKNPGLNQHILYLKKSYLSTTLQSSYDLCLRRKQNKRNIYIFGRSVGID